jgi:hypothetical protein
MLAAMSSAVTSTCAHCGAVGTSRFCGECGRPLVAEPAGPQGVRDLVRETAAEALGLDRRILASLRDLVLHPGRIVMAHVEGRDAGYVSPLKLFLFLGGIYMLCLSWVQPYSFEQQDLARIGVDATRATSLQRMLLEHGLTIQEASDRFQERMNAVTPFITALALVPLALFLGVLQRGRSMRDHLTYLLVGSNSVWLVSLLALPLALVSQPLHSTAAVIAMYVYLGIGFFAVYGGRRSSTVARFAAFVVVDFLITFVFGAVMGIAIFASIFFP